MGGGGTLDGGTPKGILSIPRLFETLVAVIAQSSIISNFDVQIYANTLPILSFAVNSILLYGKPRYVTSIGPLVFCRRQCSGRLKRAPETVVQRNR